MFINEVVKFNYSYPMKQRQGITVVQVALVVLVMGIVLVILYAMGVFAPVTPGTHEVTFRIIGSASAAVITYTQQDGSPTETLNVSIPWKKVIRYDQSLEVILTAGNPT